MKTAIKYPSWLVQVDPLANKRDTKWICVCNNCQWERQISYAQAFNIAKKTCRRECKNCQIELNLITINTSGLEIGRTKENQIKAIKNRTGIKRPNSKKTIDYGWLFSPESFSTEEGRKKQRNAKLGKFKEESNRWEGGKTENRQILMGRQEYKDLRKFVFKRDDFTCQKCFVRGGRLEMDHIKEWCNYPELRLVPENCRILCHECHVKTDNYMSKAKKKAICPSA